MTRLPSITEDQDYLTVRAAVLNDAKLPEWTERGTREALVGHGYAWVENDGTAWLTGFGVDLAARWDGLKASTAVGFRPEEGAFTPLAGQK